MLAIERSDERGPLANRTVAPQRFGVRVRTAINVQPILDGKVLQVAKPGIDPLERGVRCIVAANAGIGSQAGVARLLNDQLCQPVTAAAIETVSLDIFVDQSFKHTLVVIEPSLHQRRRQMAERDGGNAPLRLRRLAGIADDERIDHRQRSGDDFREAIAGKRHRLARQPLQRAMRTDMDDGVAAKCLLHPQAKGDECVVRR